MREIVDITNAASLTISHEKSSLDKNGGGNTTMNHNNDSRGAPANDMSNSKNIAGNERRVKTADRHSSYRQQTVPK